MSIEKKPLPNPSSTLKLTINDNEYEVKLPNTGQELDIAYLLQSLTSDKYEMFKFSSLSLMQREAAKAETIAFFNTLIPTLKDDLQIKSLLLLDRPKMNVLIEAYENYFLPWYEEWQVVFASPKAEK